jgi:hydrogenase expression/formation protein HypE
VKIVAGDTKVAGKGQVDGVFITTTGVGRILDHADPSGSHAKPGDSVLVTGDIGRHGCCILLERDEYGIEAQVESDCAPLWNNVKAVLEQVPDVHVIRDATRGGVGTVLYEITEESGVGIELDREAIPVAPLTHALRLPSYFFPKETPSVPLNTRRLHPTKSTS